MKEIQDAISYQSNVTKRPHHRRTRTVQSHSPGGANVHPSNTCFYGPTQVHISNEISIGSAIFAQLTAEQPYLYNGPTLFPFKIALHMGDQDPHLTHGPLSSLESTTNMASRSVQQFLQQSRL